MPLLSDEFLAPYRARGDVFPNLLARSIYRSKYQRPEDGGWADTIQRVVEGNCALDTNVGVAEAEGLYDAFFNMRALPAGRGLWTGGAAGIPIDSRYSCHYVTLRSVDDWRYTALMLMAGGGVGVGLQHIDELPEVLGWSGVPDALHVVCRGDHPNVDEVRPDEGRYAMPRVEVPDTREGWCDALAIVLESAFDSTMIEVDVSKIRPRGAPLKTFGGVSCGPGPLAQMLRSVHKVVRGSVGRKLTAVECLDITNLIGLCVKSGNVRRSALIVLGSPDDQGFRDAKKDLEAVESHRHSSNNSLTFETAEQLDNFDWISLADDMVTRGEPGVLNLYLARQTDHSVEGVNPCGEVCLADREACCLSEFFPSRCVSPNRRHDTLRLLTRYTLRQRLEPMSDPKADAVRTKTMRIGVGVGGVVEVMAQGARGGDFAIWKRIVRETADAYAGEIGVATPIAVTTVKPSGTISLLAGVSPGMHAPQATYYLRRTQLAKNEPMAEALIAAGVPCEPSVYDATGNTLVFTFPMHSPSEVTVQTETLEEQFERQLMLQTCWADNAVSATITFQPDEREVLPEMLAKYVPQLKSTSCLPRADLAGYRQLPYEPIDQPTYERLCEGIDFDAPLCATDDTLDIAECSGGACPVR